MLVERQSAATYLVLSGCFEGIHAFVFLLFILVLFPPTFLVYFFLKFFVQI
jgi:hypothetical protein